MTFRLVFESHKPASAAPFRVVDEQGQEVEWINRFLDMQRVRGLQELSLRAYAYTLLHFVRWWSQRPGVDARRFDAAQFTESTLIDYVRDQRNELPKLTPETINWRSGMIRRVFQFYFHQDMPQFESASTALTNCSGSGGCRKAGSDVPWRRICA